MSFQIINIADDQQWHNYRGTGIGASDVPTLIGLNPWKSRLQLFHEKLGFNSKFFINLAMLRGKDSEEFTSETFQAYTGGDINQTAYNKYKKIFSRTCEKLPDHAYIVNDDIPYLFVSPDRKFTDPRTGISGALEIKDSYSSMYLSNFADRMAPPHVIQLKTQMMAWEQQYGILAYLLDGGRDYREQMYERNGIIYEGNGLLITEDDLKREIRDFWDMVVLAREATHKMKMAELNFNVIDAQKYKAVIDQCEPDPDSSLAYESFMKDNWYGFTKPVREIQGTEEHLNLANAYLQTKEELDRAKENFQLQKNSVLNVCKAGDKILLPGKGFIQAQKNKVSVSIKVKV